MNLKKILEEEINRNNEKEITEVLEESLTQNIEELSKNANFFNLPLTNIFSIISKIDFKEIKENDKAIEIIQNIIKNIINKHFEEKETILILQNLNLKTFSFSSYEEIFSILELITNCPILVNFCYLYKELNLLPDKDYEFELQQKEIEIEKLKQKINEEISNKFPPITEKPKDYEPDIFKACKEGKLTSVQWLIEKENEDKNKKVEKTDPSLKFFEGDTPIHIASINNHLKIVQYLIEKQNVDKNIKGFWGTTPLHYACEKGYLEIVKYLISKGANIEVKDKNGKTPFTIAYKNHCSNIIEYASFNFNFPKDFEPNIFKACKEGKLTSVQWLIEKERINKNKRNENFDSPIHIATQYGHLPIVQYLIEKQNVDKDIKGNKEKTPLHYACSEGHLPVVEYLISKGANIEAQDNTYYEMTPLHYACKEGYLSIVEYLISKGANIEAKDNNEQTPLHYACYSGYLPIVEYLISKGANIEAKDRFGKTPIHYAKIRGCGETVENLISNSANT